ncbi:MAG TPA: YggS family pyridoxal phosphate-dependent enzyme [Mycobacteriales bacterium]|nr:YggS family pyridoxal phosphate-dependent enzyme [Mycobacteriales bacterium]
MSESPSAREARRAELAANLADLDQRVTLACQAAGRSRAEVSVIAVTKTFPATDVRLLAELGVTDVGENRDQEAAAKHAECADLGLRWHFVGQLQRNKARSVAGYADLVHSVDRSSLVRALGSAAQDREQDLGVLLQVSLDEHPSGRGGAAPGNVAALAAEVVGEPALMLGGVMAVAPLGADPDASFARLAQISADLRADYPYARIVSAGMTSDLEAAVRHGATHLRIGTALLGRRVVPVG